LGEQRGLEPGPVGLERLEREPTRPEFLGFLDPALDPGVQAVAGLERRDVLVGLVGEQALVTVPVSVAETQLRAGWGISLRTISRVPSRPAAEVELVCQLGHPRPVALLNTGVQRRQPPPLRQRQRRPSDPFVDVGAERDADLPAAQRLREGVGSASRVGARQDRKRFGALAVGRSPRAAAPTPARGR
jgi:hypothetical protein